MNTFTFTGVNTPIIFSTVVEAKIGYDVSVRQFPVTKMFDGTENKHEILKTDLSVYDLRKVPLSIPDFELFFGEKAKIYYDIFGKETVVKQLTHFTVGDLVEEKQFPDKTAWWICEQGGGIFASDLIKITITKTRGEWEKEEKVNGYKVIQRTQYDSNFGSKLAELCLLENYPYLKDFSFKAYSIECYDRNKIDKEQFYVHVGEKNTGNSLYVPYVALKNRDSSLIVDCMRTYWRSYYGTKTEKYKEQIDLLKTPEAIRFMEAVEHPEKFTFKTREGFHLIEKVENNNLYTYVLMVYDRTSHFVKLYKSLKSAYNGFLNLLSDSYQLPGIKENIQVIFTTDGEMEATFKTSYDETLHFFIDRLENISFTDFSH